MYLVPIAWIYVALMMSVAEATNTTGSVLGGVITFILYGVLPVTLLLYFMSVPTRRKAIKAREQAELAQWRAAAAQTPSTLQPDAGGQTPAAAQDTVVAPVGKEP